MTRAINGIWGDGIVGPAGPAGAVTATLTVAASNSTARNIAGADYTCDGTADDVQIQAALDALPATGGSVFLYEGLYNIAATITISLPQVVLHGAGKGTRLLAVAALGATEMLVVSGWKDAVRDLWIDGANIASNCVDLDFTGAGSTHFALLDALHVERAVGANIITNHSRFSTISNCVMNAEGLGRSSAIGIHTTTNSNAINIINPMILSTTAQCILIEGQWTYVFAGQMGDAGGEGIEIRTANVQIVGGEVEDVDRNAILIKSGLIPAEGWMGKISVIGVSFNQVSRAAGGSPDTYDNIAIEAADVDHPISGVVISGCQMGDAFADWLWDVDMTSYVSSVTLVGNSRMEKVNYSIANNPKVYCAANPAYITEDRGFATITTGNTTVDVTHSVNAAPSSPVQVYLSNYTAVALPAGTFVSTLSATQFRITINPALGADYTFEWQALARLYR